MHSVLHIFRIVHTTRTHTQANMEAKFMPIESMYALLAKFGVPVDEDETIRLATLRPRFAALHASLESTEEVRMITLKAFDCVVCRLHVRQ